MKKETTEKKSIESSDANNQTELNSVMTSSLDKQEKNQEEKSTKSDKQAPLLEKLFVDMLKDIYWAEKHLVEALPKMQKAATTQELQDAFEDHLYATQKHTTRLEKVFRLLG